MEAQVTKTDIKKALERGVRCIAKDAQDGESGAHLVANGKTMTVTTGGRTGSGWISIKSVIPAKVIESGIAVLPARTALERVKTASHKEVMISKTQHGASVSQQEILPLSSLEFRPQPVCFEAALYVGAPQLKQALKEVIYAAAPNWDLRPARRAVYLRSTSLNQLRLTASDEWRLAQSSAPIVEMDGIKAGDPIDLAIPVEAADILLRSLSRSYVEIAAKGAWVFFTAADFCLATTSVAGVPRDFVLTAEPQITIEREALLSVAREAKEKTKNGGWLEVDTRVGAMSVTVSGTESIQEVDESKKSGVTRVVRPTRETRQMYCRTTEDDVTFRVNPSYLADALAALGGMNVYLSVLPFAVQVRPDMVAGPHSVHLIARMETGHETSRISESREIS